MANQCEGKWAARSIEGHSDSSSGSQGSGTTIRCAPEATAAALTKTGTVFRVHFFSGGQGACEDAGNGKTTD